MRIEALREQLLIAGHSDLLFKIQCPTKVTSSEENQMA